MHTIKIIYLVLFISLGFFSAGPARSDDFPASAVQALALPGVADIDMLYIDDTIKSWLDQHIAPIRRATTRASLLHVMLFHTAYRGIRYDGARTKTALQTWYSGSGNCVSLASLYVAAARYVGLNAKFQTVKVPLEWLEKEDFYFVPGHVNASIKLPRNRVTVEFADIYPAAETQDFKSKKISDRRMLAEFYNNIGMEYLEQGLHDEALAYLVKSISTTDKLDFTWSNLGVAFKMRAMYTEAETAYKRALRLKRSNLSTLNNLYVLYVETKQEAAAEKLRDKVKRYSRSNPFYLYRLALTEQKFKNYNSAKNLVERAIRIKPGQPKFYLLLGQLHFQIGDLIASSKALNQAKQLSQNQAEIDIFQGKIDALEGLRADL